MYKNDNLIIQIAVAMIIIALLGITFMRVSKSSGADSGVDQNTLNTLVEYQKLRQQEQPVQQAVIQPVQNQGVQVEPRLIENTNSDQANIVKQYFRALAERDYTMACSLVTPDKCRGTNPASVELFSREFKKFVNQYEYVNVKDMGLRSPSNKDIVCVKYSYRYKDDRNPTLVSEVMSFYLAPVNGVLKITDRVCEKKYKEGEGVRTCPIEPNARYCVGKVK